MLGTLQVVRLNKLAVMSLPILVPVILHKGEVVLINLLVVKMSPTVFLLALQTKPTPACMVPLLLVQ